MPNHCENDLTVRGPKAEIEKFFKAVKGNDTPIDHNKIIPYPKKYANADDALEKFRKANPNARMADWPKDGYNNGGYQWCLSNWGTKWGFYNFSEVEFSKTKTSATVSFSTAWSPAIPLFQKMGEMFPNLTFTVKYYEQGAAYQGIYQVKGTEVLKDLSGPYHGNRGG